MPTSRATSATSPPVAYRSAAPTTTSMAWPPRPAGRAATTGSATLRKAPSHAASTPRRVHRHGEPAHRAARQCLRLRPRLGPALPLRTHPRVARRPRPAHPGRQPGVAERRVLQRDGEPVAEDAGAGQRPRTARQRGLRPAPGLEPPGRRRPGRATDRRLLGTRLHPRAAATEDRHAVAGQRLEPAQLRRIPPADPRRPGRSALLVRPGTRLRPQAEPVAAPRPRRTAGRPRKRAERLEVGRGARRPRRARALPQDPVARAVRPEEQQGRRQLQRQRRALRLQRPGQPVQHTDRRDPADGHRPGGLRQLALRAVHPQFRPAVRRRHRSQRTLGPRRYIRIADDAPDATDRQLVLRPSASSSGEPRP